MSFSLGIDTGGTYTDGVIVDIATRKIVSKAKALTTKEDLSVGIDCCLRALDIQNYPDIKLVAVSTTLATNAIVEGQGSPTGLIYMGAEPDEDIPAEIKSRVAGRFDIMGNLVDDIDKEEIKEVVEKMRGQVDAVAISGYASVRNPKHEQAIMDIVKKQLNIPVICAHQLTTSLGFTQRTITAVLNGRLISIIDDLIESIREVTSGLGINAPIMIVKGDGTLMTESMAKAKPIETILSGPAASVIGALALTDKKNGIVLDMGGTTSDFAELEDGRVRIRKEGAKVGGWFTRVKAVEISTFGLGGDSLIALDRKGNITIGPRKVWPLCILGAKNPGLIYEMKNFRRAGEFKLFSEHEADCYIYQGSQREHILTEEESIMVNSLKERPHSISYLAGLIRKDPETVDIDRLVDLGVVARAGFTPTDALHVLGRYNKWDRNIAVRGAEIISDRIGMSVNAFIRQVESMIYDKIAITSLQSIMDFEDGKLNVEDSPEAMKLINSSFGRGGKSVINANISLNKPIVAIGAPAEAWIVPAAEKLKTEILVPEHADVANAYGAAIGQIICQEEILITLIDGRYVMNTSWDRVEYVSREEAVFYAVHEGRKKIEHDLLDAGCHVWNIDEAFEDMHMELHEGKAPVYKGTKVTITGRADTINNI